MTLHDLTEQLLPQFPESIQKDMKTATKILAQALNYPEPQFCPLTAIPLSMPDLYHTMEAHLTAQGKGYHTIRNTKNNLSRLIRLAIAAKMFSFPEKQLSPRFTVHRLKPARAIRRPRLQDGLYLKRRQWPTDIEAEFHAFTKWATDPIIHNRDAKWKKGLYTIKKYESVFESYFGFLEHILKIQPITFNYLFDLQHIDQYVHWYTNERHQRPTIRIHMFLQCLLSMSRQYCPNPEFATQIATLKRRIPLPTPFYDKSESWIALDKLHHIGTSLWPTKPPKALNGDGSNHAAQAGLSIIFRLWVHIPYRQRNIREMQLGHHLHKDTNNQWRVRFAGNDLKIATKRGHINQFDLPFPTSLVPDLEDYLSIWRPILASCEQRTEVFLNQAGNPYTQNCLTAATKRQVYRFTGRHWHPHMIRSIWTTEWIRSGGDFMTAAIMLNDRLETVIKNYAHLRDENVAEKAYEWVSSRVNGH